MQSRIATCALTLRCGPRTARKRADAERFCRRVFELLDEELERRHPHACFILGALDAEWCVAANRLDDKEAAEVARELAQVVELESTRIDPLTDAIPGERWLHFASEPDAALAASRDELMGRPAWWAEDLMIEPLVQAWIDAAPPPRLWAWLERLAAEQQLVAWVSGRGTASREALARRASAPEGHSAALVSWLRELLDAAQGPRMGASFAAPASDGSSTRVVTRAPGAPAGLVMPTTVADGAASSEGKPSVSVTAPLQLVSSPHRVRQEGSEQRLESGLIGSPSLTSPVHEPGGQDATTTLSTDAGATGFLLNLIEELDWGATLYQSCLHEADWIVDTLVELLEVDPRDPLWRLLGERRDRPRGPIEADVFDNLTLRVFQTFCAAMTRRGASTQLNVLWTAHPDGLQARQPDTATLLLHWTGAPKRHASVAAALDACWPRAAPPMRWRRAGQACAIGGSLEPALRATMRGTLTVLAMSRLGGEPPLTALLPRRATVKEADDRLTLHFDRVVHAARRTGLDRSPGWIPWVRREVHLAFDDAEPTSFALTDDAR